MNNNDINNQKNNKVLHVKKRKINTKIVCVIGIFVVILFISVLYFGSKFDSNKIICKSEEGNITISYDETGLTDFNSSGIPYDFSTQQSYAKQLGIDEYFNEFNIWFENNTNGSCSIK